MRHYAAEDRREAGRVLRTATSHSSSGRCAGRAAARPGHGAATRRSTICRWCRPLGGRTPGRGG